jgi:hypothetical protein
MPDIEPVLPPTHDELLSSTRTILATIRHLQARCQGEALLPWNQHLKRLALAAQGIVDAEKHLRPKR